jgi:hypothetical protein
MSAYDALMEAAEADVNDCLASLEELQDLLSPSSSSADAGNTRAIGDCIKLAEGKIAKAKQSRRNVGTEVTQIKDRTERNAKGAKMKELDDSIQSVVAFIQKAKMQQNRMELLKDSNFTKDPYSTEGKTNDELLNSTNAVQDKTFQALGRTKMLIEQTKEVGAATIDELQRQRVQMADIEADIDTFESHLDRAEKLVINFTRRMASDKIIQFFMVFNIVVVVIVVIYAVVTRKSLMSNHSHSNDDNNFFGTHYPTSMPSSLSPSFSFAPTQFPTLQPSATPSFSPTPRPSAKPTANPTSVPTVRPSLTPSSEPTCVPTVEPAAVPTTPPI